MAYTVESLLMSGTLKFYRGSKVLKTPTPSLAKNPAFERSFCCVYHFEVWSLLMSIVHSYDNFSIIFCFIEEVTLISQTESPDSNVTDNQAKEVSYRRVYSVVMYI